MYWLWNLSKDMSGRLFSFGRTKERLEFGRLYRLYGLHPRLSHAGDKAADTGKESEGQVPQ